MLAVLAGLAVLVGCGQPSAATPGEPAPSATTTTPPPPVTTSGTETLVPPGVVEVPAAQIDATALSEGYSQRAWIFDGGHGLQVFGIDGGCRSARVEVLEQGAERVRLRLVSETISLPSGMSCTMELYDVPLTTRLDAPLGDRILVLES